MSGAETLKKDGNKLVGEGKYKEAIEKYMVALALLQHFFAVKTPVDDTPYGPYNQLPRPPGVTTRVGHMVAYTS